MEKQLQITPNSNPWKVMSMSREELIATLGPENEKIVTEGLKNGTLAYYDLQRICQESFSDPRESKLVRDLIMTKLSETEGFNLFESDKGKQESYVKMKEVEQKVLSGEVTTEDLKYLCDQAFGNDTGLSVYMQAAFIKAGKIKLEPSQENQENVVEQTEQDATKSWELEPEEKARAQIETVWIAGDYAIKQENQTQTQSPQQHIQQDQNMVPQQISDVGQQAPAMEI